MVFTLRMSRPQEGWIGDGEGQAVVDLVERERR